MSTCVYFSSPLLTRHRTSSRVSATPLFLRPGHPILSSFFPSRAHCHPRLTPTRFDLTHHRLSDLFLTQCLSCNAPPFASAPPYKTPMRLQTNIPHTICVPSYLSNTMTAGTGGAKALSNVSPSRSESSPPQPSSSPAPSRSNGASLRRRSAHQMPLNSPGRARPPPCVSSVAFCTGDAAAQVTKSQRPTSTES